MPLVKVRFEGALPEAPMPLVCPPLRMQSVLGVPRETILQDYHLSTAYRQPQFEMPRIDPARYPGNPVAQMFAQFQDNPAMAKPQPLKDADGTAFLSGAFDEIDAKWGSVDAYLEQEVGVTAQDRAELRRLYLQ